MLIISYDIADDKLRSRFSRFLGKFGYRLQFSVFEVKNSKKVLENVICEIESCYTKKFSETDSVLIFNLSQQCKKYCFGYAQNDGSVMIIE